MEEEKVSQEDQDPRAVAATDGSRCHKVVTHFRHSGHLQREGLLPYVRSANRVAADGVEPACVSDGRESRRVHSVSQRPKRYQHLPRSGATRERCATGSGALEDGANYAGPKPMGQTL